MIIPTQVRALPLWQVALFLVLVYVAHILLKSYRVRARSTPLGCPPRPSWLFGVSRLIINNPDASSMYEAWVHQFGSVFKIPAPLGHTRVILTDPKAIAHFYSVETWTYVQTRLARVAIENLFGRGLLWAEGESHKRQRKAISPAFSNVAIRRLTSIFYDSVYKLKTNWDNQLTSVDSALIDVQNWMNHVSLDSIGIAGFSHDFGSLEGKHPAVAEVFDAMGQLKPSPITAIVILFGNVFPFLWRLPTETRRLQTKLNHAMEEIAVPLLENTRKEMRGLGEKGKEEKSIIGLLIKAEDADSSLQMSQEEIMAQMKVLILAGYETTSISLTWALIELSRKPETQARLREELKEQFPTSDPSWEQLTNGAGLHYLDAVVHEILRIHPPLAVTSRVAAKDDIIPLSQPLRLPNGEVTHHVAVAEGQEVAIPIGYINTAKELWGEDAGEFRPERWLTPEGLPKKAQEVQGHRHLLTFVDGHRMCLGRGFALAEFKAVLGVLIKNYSFELPDGPETKIEYCRGVLPRPRVAGEKGACVPMRVRRVD
ncbi:cytochrome P450 [Lentinus tigrinus ALCF2SS1-7]|uniref:Cytochrome P450 n=1 Tax=Lentinus tigrinus ALCF2SS1-6 TaxID=1328759 RepID=A0A5C2SED8_9APHY|nr:cytochrome P450 [Lentinus tigrinus ALCF2SS1-6]RPD74674.1 cytochrome P450 [Lentinus tigrinus ALCF2SS1-7]